MEAFFKYHDKKAVKDGKKLVKVFVDNINEFFG